MINMNAYSWAGNVRVRAVSQDPYAGLSAHAYIAARGLNKPVQRITPRTTGAIPLSILQHEHRALTTQQLEQALSGAAHA